MRTRAPADDARAAPGKRCAPLSVEQLTQAVETGSVDTVVLGAADMQGRLQGKRFHARHFLDSVVAHGAEACSYLLAVDVDMNTVDGYAMSSWDQGYGDMVMVPDLETLRRTPWQEGTALVLADLAWSDGSAVTVSPRHILRRQMWRLHELGLEARVGTELEFCVFRHTYEEAWRRGYRDLVPANQYNVDYSLLDTARVEPLLRAIRNGMTGAGMVVESAKGECNFGQHEITFQYSDPLSTCDDHVVYKHGAKEIAAQHGVALTFMAKPNEREGNSCHIHLSLWSADGSPALPGPLASVGGGGHRLSKLAEQFLAGQLACVRDIMLVLAPNINSYKRYCSRSFAPTAIRWGWDNRTCALRVVGDAGSLRVENRVPGGDVNPYLAVAALIAAGIHGIERQLPLGPPVETNAYATDSPLLPSSLDEALAAWSSSTMARDAFGDDVVQHYANGARVELDTFRSAVTDWELRRGFERL